MGKTCIFTFAGGPAPPRVAELGPDVRRGDKLLAEHGFVASGTPIGTDEYTQAWGTDHLDMEEALLSAFCVLALARAGSVSRLPPRSHTLTAMRVAGAIGAGYVHHRCYDCRSGEGAMAQPASEVCATDSEV
ncbi:hypothetical protein AK812_SmicGene38755 [Symbiodinium microadriaticum]|uniref:Uncharacterized protein n=1 Tax=Symbiodinium microadriaticum TaxID=2951 RepID=A0A1Q9CD75_SYMMI|nr:hypothetical protein AK812_SmicGene38755 [Symbiodinium microadriaticum]